jgi:hypothetical protein
MKTVLHTLFAALLAVASASIAQTQPGDLTVDVPFAFVVAGKQLPAGHYTVNMETNFVRITTPGSGVMITTHAASRKAADGSKLVFHRYGNTYFLSSMWVSGNTVGRELVPSRTERDMARRNAELELAQVRAAQ